MLSCKLKLNPDTTMYVASQSLSYDRLSAIKVSDWIHASLLTKNIQKEKNKTIFPLIFLFFIYIHIKYRYGGKGNEGKNNNFNNKFIICETS